jgi:hypothetical protein
MPISFVVTYAEFVPPGLQEFSMRNCVRKCLAGLVLAPLLWAGLTGHAQETTAAQAATPEKQKGKKAEYTGPNTVVELAPTPMLDAEGKQQLDPDGKPMFNSPVRQQRDKKGHPLFDEAGKPVMQTNKELGYDEHGKKVHPEKEKKVKATPISISRGVLTVDGLTGKAALNYDIADLKYIYFFAPGIGITVISNAPFPGAKEQPKAFDDKTLTVTADGHVLQLASDNRLLGKKPESAFVLVDRAFMLPLKFPAMGYGATNKPPYAWPGAKANEKLAGPVEAPPLPANLLPVQLLKPCPAGQMRPAATSASPGQGGSNPSCVPIAKATASAATAPVAAKD